MDTDAAPQPGDNPATVYSKRLGELLHLQAAEQRQEKRLGFAKVVLALCDARLCSYLSAKCDCP